MCWSKFSCLVKKNLFIHIFIIASLLTEQSFDFVPVSVKYSLRTYVNSVGTQPQQNANLGHICNLWDVPYTPPFNGPVCIIGDDNMLFGQKPNGTWLHVVGILCGTDLLLWLFCLAVLFIRLQRQWLIFDCLWIRVLTLTIHTKNNACQIKFDNQISIDDSILVQYQQ